MESMRKFKEITNIIKDRLNRIRSKKKEMFKQIDSLESKLKRSENKYNQIEKKFLTLDKKASQEE